MTMVIFGVSIDGYFCYMNTTATTNTNYRELYQALGYLFYSVAASDKKIASKETVKLQELVTKNWLTLEDSEDKFGMDNGHIISITYEMLTENAMSAEEAWENFREFYELNRELFSGNIKDMLITTAEDIARTYWHTNKAELNRLARLLLLFGK